MTISRGVQASWWVKERGWRLALLNMRLGIHFDKYYWTVTYDINLHHKPLFSQSRSHSIPIYLYLPQKVRSISFFQSSLYKLSKWSIFYFYSAILFYLAHLQAKVRSNSNPSQFTVTRLLFRHAYVAGPFYAPHIISHNFHQSSDLPWHGTPNELILPWSVITTVMMLLLVVIKNFIFSSICSFVLPRPFNSAPNKR